MMLRIRCSRVCSIRQLGSRLLSVQSATQRHVEQKGESPLIDGIYSEEHQRLRESLRKLIDKEINPYVDEWEQKAMFPAHTVFKKLGDGGFLGITKPTEFGGLGLDFSYAVAAAEELGNVRCGGVSMAIGVQSEMATPALANFGSDELRREFLAPSISGDLVACVGVSEPSAGSDVAGIQTYASVSGDDLVINGSKTWITNGVQADWMCMLANTRKDGASPWKSKSLICVPLKAPGVHLSKKIEKMGMHSSDTAQLFFEDVRVPRKNIIGEEGLGFVYQMLQFQFERLWATASSIAGMETIIRETIEYTRDRKAFGRSILDNQVVHFRLAELETEVEALRSLLYRAVALQTQGNDVTKLASMAKLKGGRLAREVADACLQYWGGMGYTNECIVSRFLRDMRLLSIGGGADEVMLGIICKYMGTLPAGELDSSAMKKKKV